MKYNFSQKMASDLADKKILSLYHLEQNEEIMVKANIKIMFTFLGTNLNDQAIGIEQVVQKPNLRLQSVSLSLSNT